MRANIARNGRPRDGCPVVVVAVSKMRGSCYNPFNRYLIIAKYLALERTSKISRFVAFYLGSQPNRRQYIGFSDSEPAQI